MSDASDGDVLVFALGEEAPLRHGQFEAERAGVSGLDIAGVDQPGAVHAKFRRVAEAHHPGEIGVAPLARRAAGVGGMVDVAAVGADMDQPV